MSWPFGGDSLEGILWKISGKDRRGHKQEICLQSHRCNLKPYTILTRNIRKIHLDIKSKSGKPTPLILLTPSGMECSAQQ